MHKVRISGLLLALIILCPQVGTYAASSMGAEGSASSTQALSSQSPKLDGSKPYIPTPRSFKIHAGITQEYVMGPGDVFAITDTTEDKAAVQIVPILPDGTAVTSYTGVITAAGLTLRDLNLLINEKASKWYVNPQLMVNLAKQRPTQVYLLGELAHPGLYSVGGDSGMVAPTESSGSDSDSSSGGGAMALSGFSGSSTFTLSAALQMSGGLKETADVRHIRVTRLAPKQTFQIDLWKLMIDGDVSEDILLEPGDVVYVPRGGAEFDTAELGKLASGTKKVRVLGGVKSPGLQSMSADDDLFNVLAKAGGFADNAKRKYIYLCRTNRDGTVSTEKINYKQGLRDGHAAIRGKVRSGDIVIVKDSKLKTAANAAGRMLPQMLMYGVMYTLIYRMENRTN